MSDNYVMGIDLGTTNTTVGVFHNGNIEIIENEFGDKLTPSVVTFLNDEIFFGKKNTNVKNACSIRNIKRIMGKTFDESDVEKYIEDSNCKIVNVGNEPKIEIDWKGGKVFKTPHEISSLLLTNMKELVQKRFQKPIVNCVITVPAHFNNNQRMATKAAGKIAGLNVLQILNEPTAASYDYGVMGSETHTEKTVLVYDFGGGTLDVSVLTITENTFDVFRHYGNMHLGGEDINDILEQYFINDLKQKYPSVCINKRLKYEIRKKCDEIKNRLSYDPKVQTVYKNDMYDIEFDMKLTRAKFENLCKTVFKEAMKPIHKVLTDADLTVSQIDEVILVGGTTKIPKIREMIQEIFQKEINFSLNPFESVARGAAIHAANLINIQSKDEKRTITMDVTPLTLGIETAGKFSTPIIIRGTNIPFKTTKTFTTHRDNQESVTIKVLEGERAYSNDNHQLGTFQLLNLPKAKRGDLKIEVTYFINKDGILDISANLKGSKDVKRITIGKEHYCFDEAVINTMKLEAEKFLKADRITKKLRKEMEEYENFLYNNLHLVEGKSEEISKIYKDEIEWTEKNEYLKSDMLTERKKSFHERIQIFKE